MATSAEPERRDDVVPVRYAPILEAVPDGQGAFAATDAKPGQISLLQAVLNKKWLIVGTVLLVAIPVAILLQLVTPRYTAEATVMLEFHGSPLSQFVSSRQQAPLPDYVTDSLALKTELETMRSPALARAVAEKLDLEKLPEFNEKLRKANPIHTLLVSLRDSVKDTMRRLFGGGTSASDQVPVTPLDNATRALQDHLTISNDGRSYIVTVRADSEDPRLAAEIANTFVATYLDRERDAKIKAMRWATDWLTQQVAELSDKVRQADEALETYKAQHHLLQVRGATVTDQQLAELNTQLTLAATERAQKEAALREAVAMAHSPNGVDAAAQVLASPVIQRLREREAELEGRAADMSTRYGPAYPAMVNIKAQIADLRKKIVAEIDRVVQSMQGEVDAARAREKALQASLSALQGSASTQQQAQGRVDEMERDAKTTRALYEAYLARQKEVVAEQTIQQPDARSVTEATIPLIPSWPQKILTLVAAMVAAAMISVLVALLLEYLKRRYPQSAEELEHYTGVRTLGVVPETDRVHGFGASGETAEGDIGYREAIRAVHARLQLQARPPKVLLVTSSVPEEGKTFFSVSLARSFALEGLKTLLIDCDFRRPSVKDRLPSNADPEGDFPIETEKSTSLHYVAQAKKWIGDESVNSQRLRSAINWARQHYDVVVIDSPPIIPFSDALSLSALADATLFLVRWGHTPIKVASSALKDLDAHGTGRKWAILSRADLRKQADSGYAYYLRRYAGHYGRA